MYSTGQKRKRRSKAWGSSGTTVGVGPTTREEEGASEVRTRVSVATGEWWSTSRRSSRRSSSSSSVFTDTGSKRSRRRDEASEVRVPELRGRDRSPSPVQILDPSVFLSEYDNLVTNNPSPPSPSPYLPPTSTLPLRVKPKGT